MSYTGRYGTYRVDLFPQLEKYNAHTVFLNISSGQNYVPANRIMFLGRPDASNPYNPARIMNFAS
jgi:hypothetical protein